MWRGGGLAYIVGTEPLDLYKFSIRVCVCGGGEGGGGG